MKKNVLLSSILSLALTQIIMAESPPEIEFPTIDIDKPTVCLPQPQEWIVPPIDTTEEVIEEELPSTSATPSEYSVSLLEKGSVETCKGVIIAPSWVLTAKHCVTSKLTHVTDETENEKVNIEKKLRFYKSDIALLKLANPVFNKKDMVMVAGEPLLREFGEINYKKVTHSASEGTEKVSDSLKFKIKSKRKLKSLSPSGEAGSSGAPWVVNTDMGDVVVAVTHSGGVGAQVAYAKPWIDKMVKRHTPKEHIKWLIENDIVLEAQ